MTKEQKQQAEHKHRMVHKFLVKNFPGCEVKYNGVDGIDHQIIFNGRTVYLETKTCQRIIKAGVRQVENRPMLKQHFRLGRYRFNQREVHPYKISQHQDLLNLNGWYVFVVGWRIRGMPAHEVDKRVGGDWGRKFVVWDKIIFMCHPDWLEHLKAEVYGIKNAEFGKVA